MWQEYAQPVITFRPGLLPIQSKNENEKNYTIISRSNDNIYRITARGKELRVNAEQVTNYVSDLNLEIYENSVFEHEKQQERLKRRQPRMRRVRASAAVSKPAVQKPVYLIDEDIEEEIVVVVKRSNVVARSNDIEESDSSAEEPADTSQIDVPAEEEDLHLVDTILEHGLSDPACHLTIHESIMLYKVRWADQSESWEPAYSFDDQTVLEDYHVEHDSRVTAI